MKQLVIAISLVCGLSAAASAQAPQGRGGGRGPAAPAITTFQGDIQADWTRTRTLITSIVDAMPEDKFGFKPTPPQQSFGERVLHAAQVNLMLLEVLGAKTPAPKIDMSVTSKAASIDALQRVGDYGVAVIKELGEQGLHSE